MADISDKLRIKYGLSAAPSPARIAAWVSETERLIRLGYDTNEAGEKAAHLYFPDYKSMVTKSAADTIEELLNLAKKK